MREAYPAIQQAGAEVAAIGNGTPEEAARLKQAQDLPFALLTDPGRASYKAAGLRDSVGASLSPKLVLNGLRAFKQGFRQGRIQGSALQQGGVLVLDVGGAVLARHVSSTGGDHPPNEWILDAVKSSASYS